MRDFLTRTRMRARITSNTNTYYSFFLSAFSLYTDFILNLYRDFIFSLCVRTREES